MKRLAHFLSALFVFAVLIGSGFAHGDSTPDPVSAGAPEGRRWSCGFQYAGTERIPEEYLQVVERIEIAMDSEAEQRFCDPELLGRRIRVRAVSTNDSADIDLVVRFGESVCADVSSAAAARLTFRAAEDCFSFEAFSRLPETADSSARIQVTIEVLAI